MVNLDAPVEEIQLTASTVPVDEPKIEPRTARVRFELTQKNPGRGIYRQFAVCDDQCLHIVEQTLRRKRRFRIGLAFLDPEPQRQLVLAKGWGYLAVTAFSAAVVLGVVSRAADTTVPLLPATILCAAFATVFLLALLYHSRLLLHYRTRHGALTLVELLWGRPSRRHYHDFSARLSGAIREAQRCYEGGLQQALADELREHRRLRETGIIETAAYENAKGRILAAHT